MFERTVPASRLVGTGGIPLCDLISKIRETYQYVNIGKNRERGRRAPLGGQNILYNVSLVTLYSTTGTALLDISNLTFHNYHAPLLSHPSSEYDFRLPLFTLPKSVPKKLFVFNLT